MKANEATGRFLTTREDFVAELAAAAYAVALRHGTRTPWLDLELELWHALNDTVSRLNPATRHIGGVQR
jgi:hypothetical protein